MHIGEQCRHGRRELYTTSHRGRPGQTPQLTVIRLHFLSPLIVSCRDYSKELPININRRHGAAYSAQARPWTGHSSLDRHAWTLFSGFNESWWLILSHPPQERTKESSQNCFLIYYVTLILNSNKYNANKLFFRTTKAKP